MPVTRKLNSRAIAAHREPPTALDFYAVGIPAACLVGAFLAVLVELL